MIQTNIPCRECGKPMIGIKVGRYYRLVCDNGECLLFREGQGSRECNIDLTEIITSMPAPLPKAPSLPRGRLLSGKKNKKKTVRRKGLEYSRRTLLKKE
jgi:hypothetical protein